MKWFLGAMRKYATFSGCAGRREYWYFMLFSILLGCYGYLIYLLVKDSEPRTNRYGDNPKFLDEVLP